MTRSKYFAISSFFGIDLPHIRASCHQVRTRSSVSPKTISAAIVHTVFEQESDDILHSKMTISLKVDGLGMEWDSFVPVFFFHPETRDAKDLACQSTFGWKSHAALSNSGIGIMHLGTKRYMVSSKGCTTIMERIRLPAFLLILNHYLNENTGRFE